MVRKKDTNVSKILKFLEETFESLPAPFETPYSYIKRVNRMPYRYYHDTIRQMKKRGVVEVFEKQGKKFVKLTHKGQLETLLYGLRSEEKHRWDGKWRMVIFDIPEESRSKRDMIRRLLKRGGFVKLQQSVFISPFKLQRKAIEYLKKTHLIEFIRIIRVEEMDDDKDLRIRFKLESKN